MLDILQRDLLHLDSEDPFLAVDEMTLQDLMTTVLALEAALEDISITAWSLSKLGLA